MIFRYIIFVLFGIILMAASCEKETPGPGGCSDCPDDDLIGVTLMETKFEPNLPSWIPRINVPATNTPWTQEKIALGRMLFYDPILSADSTIACATCHLQEKSFTDGLAVSKGIAGREGTRSAMALVNLAYHTKGFFWDGRSSNLEEQALLPVEDHVEMDESWSNVELKIRQHPEYPKLFGEAFGVERKSQITKDLVVKAIAQFEMTLISSLSKFERITWLNEGWFSDEEERGRKLFFFEEADQTLEHPGCSHCHNGPNLSNNDFMNNGLDNVNSLTDFVDLGRGGANNKLFDNGKFKVPTLRNIELTAPYMHDGRFETLEEVLDHYQGGGHGVENEDVNIRPFTLKDQQKADLIAFLKTLTDTTFINNPAFSNPFQ